MMARGTGFMARVVVLAWAAAAACGCGGTSAGDPCTGVGCSEMGLCVSDGVEPYCWCPRGFHPTMDRECLANDVTNPCAGVTCSGRGTCRVEDGLPACECDEGYYPDPSGLNCMRRPLLDGSDAGDDTGDGGDADADSGDSGDADADPGDLGDGDADLGDVEGDEGADTTVPVPWIVPVIASAGGEAVSPAHRLRCTVGVVSGQATDGTRVLRAGSQVSLAGLGRR